MHALVDGSRRGEKKRRKREDTHQIWTLRADIPSFFASSMRSSVEGKAVRLYVSLRTLSCSASARLRFFLTGSGCGSGLYVEGGTTEGTRGYGEAPWPIDVRKGPDLSTRDPRL